MFFGIDGTLLDTDKFASIARQGAIDVMIENGLPSNQEEAYKLLKEIIAEKGPNYTKHFNILVERICGKEDHLLIALAVVTYENIKFSLLRPFPKTIATLIYLKSKGYKLGVITNGVTIKQWEKLVRLELHEFFDKIIASQEIGIEKPEKDIFEEAMRRMDCAPENSVMIGDRFEVDIMGAVNAGMSAILVNSNYDQKIMGKVIENFDVEIIDTIQELKKIL
jgi:putative hydrolase of the HAD superfamily